MSERSTNNPCLCSNLLAALYSRSSSFHHLYIHTLKNIVTLLRVVASSLYNIPCIGEYAQHGTIWQGENTVRVTILIICINLLIFELDSLENAEVLLPLATDSQFTRLTYIGRHWERLHSLKMYLQLVYTNWSNYPPTGKVQFLNSGKLFVKIERLILVYKISRRIFFRNFLFHDYYQLYCDCHWWVRGTHNIASVVDLKLHVVGWVKTIQFTQCVWFNFNNLVYYI